MKKLTGFIFAIMLLAAVFLSSGVINLNINGGEAKELKAYASSPYVPLPLNEGFEYERGTFDEFTDSDIFDYFDSQGIKHEGELLGNYKTNNLYGSTVSIENINYITDGHRYFLDVLRAVGDDPIVNIVPREFFNSVGNYTVVGKEYGIALRFRPNVKSQQAPILVGLI